MVLVTFNEHGMVTKSVRFGERENGEDFAAGVEVPAGTWHTVIALVSGSVLLEVKAGPFDPSQPKDPAPWAPDEGSQAAFAYLNQLIDMVKVCPIGHIADAEIPFAPQAACNCPSDS
jgi:hypothetical protein